MSPREEKPPWNVFEGMKTISVAPEALMAEINSAITALEYARAATFLQSPPPAISKSKNSNKKMNCEYDAGMADEAYKAGLAAMAAGKMDKAVVSLNTALSKCPPDKTSAVAKLRSLISLTSQQIFSESSYSSIKDGCIAKEGFELCMLHANMESAMNDEKDPEDGDS
ncbi:hypothetical protein BUALT_Bualt08G0053600 [Buddleja alternifolia]|uniref:Uncharacterized protein n=1 Tax=Buddleja alternifolia TaxID=168488 RepID=A0AAV6X3B4_9LAMI|nr:hypothetical protein BUALT_Bualt08G0053600 [Buddleja alternifolia]